MNPKIAGLPDTPGEFWPVISWKGPGGGARDDGTVSYYQYATSDDLSDMQRLRRGVVQKVIARAPPDKPFAVLLGGLDLPLAPQHPHVALYYFDAGDGTAWGAWFAARIGDWSARFQAAPETLDRYCWRVLWRKP